MCDPNSGDCERGAAGGVVVGGGVAGAGFSVDVTNTLVVVHFI